MAVAIVGITGGADLAMFTLGVLSPATNHIGVSFGYLVSVCKFYDIPFF